jgi:hypothetical protein
MNGAAYGTHSSFKFGRVYIMVPSELHTLECNNERAKAKI